MTDFTARSRLYATPFMFDKIFTIGPEFTWDIHEFVRPVRCRWRKSESRN